MASEARFILLLAGTQSGKSIFGPWWMLREIMKCGPGDYLVVTPTFPLLELKCLPEYRRLFKERLQLGEYRGSPSRVFNISARGEEILFGAVQPNNPTRILFAHAQDPDSLESATAKAAHLDEAGQRKFKLGSYEAILRRLSIHQGRILFTTTPYVLGWLKNEVHDRAKRGEQDYDLIQFESIMNPAFPVAEFERMRQVMPRWKFNMMYCGRFERPAGMIYDCWDKEKHTIPRFEIPAKWPRYLGMDFGGVNTAGVFLANEPRTQRYILYRTYLKGSRTAKEHVEKLMLGEPCQPTACGGSWSEDHWRREYAAAGLPIQRPPINEVEVGIDRIYAMLKAKIDGRYDEPSLEVVEDLVDIIDEIESYSRVLDDNDEPTEKIEDKETYHRLDGLRYLASLINNQDANWADASEYYG